MRRVHAAYYPLRKRFAYGAVVAYVDDARRRRLERQMLILPLMFSLIGSTAGAQSLAVGADMRSGSAGTLDGLRADGSLPIVGPLSASFRVFARLNRTQYSDSDIDEWQRSKRLGLLNSKGEMPISIDVWASDLLFQVRLPVVAVPIHLQAGWEVRGQATAVLYRDDGRFLTTTDGWQGQVRTRWANPTVGVSVGVPVGGPISAEVTIQQVFPINDPVLSPDPGFTVVGVSMRVGRKGARSGGERSPSSEDGDGIRDTGVEKIDELFTQVESIHEELTDLEASLTAAVEDANRAARGVGANSMSEVLAGLASGDLNLSLEVSLSNGRPKITPTAELSGEVKDIADALEGTYAAAEGVREAVPALIEKSKKLADAAQALAKDAPNIARSSGLSPMQVPKTVSNIQHNVKVSVELPGQLADTLSAAEESLMIFAPPRGGK